jgi:hypothetical protein
MDKDIFDLVYYCRTNGFSQKAMNEAADYDLIYKYVLNKFLYIQEMEVFNMYEYLQKNMEYLENISLLEKYKRRKLKPMQFAKEKEKQLSERLKKHLEYLKAARDSRDKEREKELKIEIDEIKNLIKAHEEKIKRIKLEK